MNNDIVFSDTPEFEFTDTDAVVWDHEQNMIDAPIVHCCACGEIYLEDPVMYDAGICPRCGAGI